MKVKRIISSVLHLAIAAIFLLSASGYKVYLHHCNSSNTTEISFFVSSFSCQHPLEKTDGSEISHVGCSGVGGEQISGNEDGCCNTDSSFYKISDKYDSRTQTLQISLSPVMFEQPTSTVELKEAVELMVKPQYYQPPPPVQGSDMIVIFHQLTIAHLS